METDLNCVPSLFSLARARCFRNLLVWKFGKILRILSGCGFFLFFWGDKVMKVPWFDRVLCGEVYEKQRWEREGESVEYTVNEGTEPAGT